MGSEDRSVPWWLWPTVLVIVGAGAFAAWRQSPPQAAKAMCIDQLRDSLRSPSTMVIDGVEIEPFDNGFELSIRYQAANGFNAMIAGRARCNVRTDGGARIEKFDAQL